MLPPGLCASRPRPLLFAITVVFFFSEANRAFGHLPGYAQDAAAAGTKSRGLLEDGLAGLWCKYGYQRCNSSSTGATSAPQAATLVPLPPLDPHYSGTAGQAPPVTAAPKRQDQEAGGNAKLPPLNTPLIRGKQPNTAAPDKQAPGAGDTKEVPPLHPPVIGGIGAAAVWGPGHAAGGASPEGHPQQGRALLADANQENLAGGKPTERLKAEETQPALAASRPQEQQEQAQEGAGKAKGPAWESDPQPSWEQASLSSAASDSTPLPSQLPTQQQSRQGAATLSEVGAELPASGQQQHRHFEAAPILNGFPGAVSASALLVLGLYGLYELWARRVMGLRLGKNKPTLQAAAAEQHAAEEGGAAGAHHSQQQQQLQQQLEEGSVQGVQRGLQASTSFQTAPHQGQQIDQQPKEGSDQGVWPSLQASTSSHRASYRSEQCEQQPEGGSVQGVQPSLQASTSHRASHQSEQCEQQPEEGSMLVGRSSPEDSTSLQPALQLQQPVEEGSTPGGSYNTQASTSIQPALQLQQPAEEGSRLGESPSRQASTSFQPGVQQQQPAEEGSRLEESPSRQASATFQPAFQLQQPAEEGCAPGESSSPQASIFFQPAFQQQQPGQEGSTPGGDSSLQTTTSLQSMLPQGQQQLQPEEGSVPSVPPIHHVATPSSSSADEKDLTGPCSHAPTDAHTATANRAVPLLAIDALAQDASAPKMDLALSLYHLAEPSSSFLNPYFGTSGGSSEGEDPSWPTSPRLENPLTAECSSLSNPAFCRRASKAAIAKAELTLRREAGPDSIGAISSGSSPALHRRNSTPSLYRRGSMAAMAAAELSSLRAMRRDSIGAISSGSNPTLHRRGSTPILYRRGSMAAVAAAELSLHREVSHDSTGASNSGGSSPIEAFRPPGEAPPYSKGLDGMGLCRLEPQGSPTFKLSAAYMGASTGPSAEEGPALSGRSIASGNPQDQHAWLMDGVPMPTPGGEAYALPVGTQASPLLAANSVGPQAALAATEWGQELQAGGLLVLEAGPSPPIPPAIPVQAWELVGDSAAEAGPAWQLEQQQQQEGGILDGYRALQQQQHTASEAAGKGGGHLVAGLSPDASEELGVTVCLIKPPSGLAYSSSSISRSGSDRGEAAPTLLACSACPVSLPVSTSSSGFDAAEPARDERSAMVGYACPATAEVGTPSEACAVQQPTPADSLSSTADEATDASSEECQVEEWLCSGVASLTSKQFDREVQLGPLLGVGAMGSVHQATWRGQQVAVKILHPSQQMHPASLASFAKEVQVLGRIGRHPRIASVLAACLQPPHCCIIQELASRGSLYSALHEEKLCPQFGMLLQLAEDIASAMHHCHLLSPPVVHRDLKTHNILLDADGRARVADFGIAAIKNRTFITNNGRGALGTVAYMAPETFSHGNIDERADVFSFGVIIWECLTGKEPWAECTNIMQIVMAVGVERRRLPIPPDCPAMLRQLIKDCWREAADRRPSFGEVLMRLQAIRSAGAGQPRPAASRPSLIPAAPSAHRPSLQPAAPSAHRPSLQPAAPSAHRPSLQPAAPSAHRPSLQPAAPSAKRPSVQPAVPSAKRPSVQPAVPSAHRPSVQPKTGSTGRDSLSTQANNTSELHGLKTSSMQGDVGRRISRMSTTSSPGLSPSPSTSGAPLMRRM